MTRREIGGIQPSILFHKDGKLQAVGRTQQSRIFEIWSADDRKTWGRMTLTIAESTPAPMPVTLKDGRQLLVYNHNARQTNNKGRSPLNVAVSTDGKEWSAALVRSNDPEAPNGFAYPAVIQTSDGLVHTTTPGNASASNTSSSIPRAAHVPCRTANGRSDHHFPFPKCSRARSTMIANRINPPSRVFSNCR
jgi:hypothetical protein